MIFLDELVKFTNFFSIPVPTFQRFQVPITIFVNPEDIDSEKRYLSSVGKIADLKVQRFNNTDSSKLVVEFTEPDFASGNDRLQVNYMLRYSTSLKDILDDFDTLANEWVYGNNSFGTNNFAMSASFMINLMDEPSLFGQTFYLAIKPVFSEGTLGKMSNVVRVFVPKKQPTTQYSNNQNFNGHALDIDPHVESPSYDSDDDTFTKLNHKVASIKYEILLLVIAGVLLLLFTCVICWCLSRRKKNEKSKTHLKANGSSRGKISVISPSPSYSRPAYTEQINAPVHNYLDHQIIGLPIEDCLDDEMIKTDYIDHDDSKHQGHYQTQPYHSNYNQNNMHMENDTGLQWASYLLQQHEKRLSPLDHNDPSMMYSNGELCPQIPDLPNLDHSYHTYGYGPNAQVYGRPLGSMQSVVSGAIGSDRKVRNITMV